MSVPDPFASGTSTSDRNARALSELVPTSLLMALCARQVADLGWRQAGPGVRS